jgi:hypothetical protein
MSVYVTTWRTADQPGREELTQSGPSQRPLSWIIRDRNLWPSWEEMLF